ncbi:LysR family transcriptional regulator [Rhodospirillaceae bacterium KN72]|uniref:LysR family transcriptional regulator n=1 Tax=Pacificispira spongiicola TaxID=2729598 RepID=A0A7Y0E1H3_9PROT|nr:LysR family transcriptional regulator [Pacificispira spongiicola]NMM45507.1 LysR family transcriptional regulator [Pacificispira spongiicola]
MQDLSGIAVFTAVVESGSFTGAAEKLGQSKSAISKQVTRLEQRLGAQLLARTTRRLHLTEIGQAFYERCRRIIAEAEEAELAVTHLQEIPRGKLRVSAPLSFGISHLAAALPDFMAANPELLVDIDFSDRRVDIIEEGFDMAIRITPRLEDSSLIAKRIAQSRRPILASPAYWEKHGKPKRPEDLADHNCLTYAYIDAPNSWRFRDPDDPSSDLVVRVSGTLHSNSGNALAQAAANGLGVVLSPAFLCACQIKTGELEPALEAFEGEPLGIHALYPPNRHLSTKVRAFIDFLTARFAGPELMWPQ